MKSLAAIVGGAAMGIVLVAVVGALAVQSIGLQAGAVFDLSNTVVGITSPRRPVLPSLGIVTISILVLFILTFVASGFERRDRVSLVAGFFAATAALVVWGFTLMVGRDAGAEQTVGVLEGWTGWIEKGGLNSAVHLVTVLSIASLWLRPAPFKVAAVDAEDVNV